MYRTSYSATAIGLTVLLAASIAASQERSVPLRSAPLGRLIGQIRDDNGVPLPGVVVQALVVSYQQGRRVLVAPSLAPGVLSSSTVTDAKGEYRFGLPPGVYYVCAQHRTSNVSEDGAARVFGGSQKVYYPGTLDPALAATVTLNGGETPGIDFKVAHRDSYKIFVHLDGQVVQNITPAGTQIAELRDRISLDRLPVLSSLRRGAGSSSRSLVIDGVPNGSYDLLVDGMMEDGSRGRGIASIDVRGEDLHDVVVAFQPAQDIAGRILGADPATPLSFSGLTVLLGTRDARVDPDGTFVVPKVLSGFYPVTVNGLPPDAYIADIRYGGASLHEAARSLSGPELQAGLLSTPLQILVATNGGAVEGTIDAEAAPGATVVLVPSPDRRFLQSYYKTTNAGPAGAFSFRGVPPGVYQLFAWERVPETAWLNSEFMSHWEGRGKAVSIEAGRTVNVRTRLLRDD